MDVTGLEPGSEYKFRVVALNAEGESEPLEADKSIIAKDPYDAPSAPGKPDPTDWNVDFVDLKWKEPSNDGGSPITAYIIEKRELGTTKFFKAAEIKGGADL